MENLSGISGYAAATLVLFTFIVKDTRLLRTVAIFATSPLSPTARSSGWRPCFSGTWCCCRSTLFDLRRSSGLLAPRAT